MHVKYGRPLYSITRACLFIPFQQQRVHLSGSVYNVALCGNIAAMISGKEMEIKLGKMEFGLMFLSGFPDEHV